MYGVMLCSTCGVVDPPCYECDEVRQYIRQECMKVHPSNFKPERGFYMIVPVKYERNPFHVEAVQVTADNLHELAEWCGGRVHIVAEDNPSSAAGAYYIKVQVKRPLSARQTKAFVTDWVLSAGTGFKVYTDSAFQKSFSPWIPFETELDDLSEGDTSEKALFHSQFGTEKEPYPVLFEDAK